MPHSRRTRSKMDSLDDEHRQALYDVAKQRMKATINKPPADVGGRAVHQPVKDTTPANTGVNRNAGSPREGRKFRIKDVAGGKQHIYGDGSRMFVGRKYVAPGDAKVDAKKNDSDRDQMVSELVKQRQHVRRAMPGESVMRKRRPTPMLGRSGR